MNNKYYTPISTNKNARIRSRVTRTGNFRTETHRRETGLSFAATTCERDDRTRFIIDGVETLSGKPLILNGHEARTIHRVLCTHYRALGKSW